MRASRLAKVFVCLLALCLVGIGPVFAQTQTGSINGVVKDPNGEALPGVAVTITGSAVMGSKTAVTGQDGRFRVPSLLPGGDFVVNFALDGFSTVIREGTIVAVGQTTTLQVVMTLSAVADEIVVTGETPMVDITSPTASTTFSTDLLDNIPNNGRTWSAAVMQAPGVVNGSSEGYGDLYSSRGGTVVTNEIAFDGVANTNPVYNTAGHRLVYEAVEEVQVVTGAMPAELGNLAGTYINVVTKSGGNEFRGDIGYYYQDEGLQGDNLTDELREAGLETPSKLTDFEDWSFNLGGPIVRDKLWFNLGYWRAVDFRAVDGFPYDNGSEVDSYIGKLTWQPSSNHNLSAMYNGSPGSQPWYGATRFITPDATQTYDFSWELGKLAWTWVLSDNAFLNTDVSTATTDSKWRPQADATHSSYEILTGMVWGGPPNTQFNSSVRDQASATLSWFKDGWGGNHAFKGGLQWEHSEFIWDNYQGDTPFSQQALLGGQAYYVIFYNMPPNGRVTTQQYLDGFHGYIQDTWAVTDRVTLNLGVRMNSWTGSYPAQGNPGYQYGASVNLLPIDVPQTDVLDWTAFEPRLGATIALDDAGKSALRIGLSRYHHSMNISSILLANPNALTLAASLWTDSNGDLFADPEEVWYTFLTAGGAANTVDPNASQPYTDEITIGFERELFADFSLTVNATWREDHDIVSDIDVGTTDDSFVPIDVPDPGADNVFGTADDQMLTLFNQVSDFATELLITNTDLAKRDYKGIEVVATKRLTNNWQALASIVWSESTGTLGQDVYSSRGWLDGLDNPNDLVNLGGPLSLDREWQFKLIGTYLLPLGFSVSGYYRYVTGVPLYRNYSVTGLGQTTATVTADPWDTHRLDDYSQLDLRAEKVFAFGARPIEVSLLLDVFNVFNENSVTSRYTATGIWNYQASTFTPGPFDFGTPLAVQAPRIIRFGARLRF